MKFKCWKNFRCWNWYWKGKKIVSEHLKVKLLLILGVLILYPRGAGIGGLGITVEGPSESKMSCKDNKDGSCSVEYVPFTAGLYDVNITYGGEHIPGEITYSTSHADILWFYDRLVVCFVGETLKEEDVSGCGHTDDTCWWINVGFGI